MISIVMDNDPISIVKDNMDAYFKTHDVEYLTDDVVFVNMATGEEIRGRKKAGQFLFFIFHVAFDATSHLTNKLISTDRVLVEGFFAGTHIGEYKGIPATYKKVNIPFCISYDLENGLISKARVYIMHQMLVQQIS